MIRPRDIDSTTATSKALYALIARDQRLNICLLIPGLFLYGVLGVACLKLAPQFFLERQGHGWLAAGQLASLIAYLCYAVRFFDRLAPLIQQRQEERKALIRTSKEES
jgi:hypothetical protein